MQNLQVSPISDYLNSIEFQNNVIRISNSFEKIAIKLEEMSNSDTVSNNLMTLSKPIKQLNNTITELFTGNKSYVYSDLDSDNTQNHSLFTREQLNLQEQHNNLITSLIGVKQGASDNNIIANISKTLIGDIVGSKSYSNDKTQQPKNILEIISKHTDTISKNLSGFDSDNISELKGKNFKSKSDIDNMNNSLLKTIADNSTNWESDGSASYNSQGSISDVIREIMVRGDYSDIKTSLLTELSVKGLLIPDNLDDEVAKLYPSLYKAKEKVFKENTYNVLYRDKNTQNSTPNSYNVRI